MPDQSEDNKQSQGRVKDSASTRRVSCHRCGNLRKNKIHCTKCPQVYCHKCEDKMIDEHGQDVFSGGCPVCKEICCCGKNKSLECTKKYHCYKKCPKSKGCYKPQRTSQGVMSSASTSTSASPPVSTPPPAFSRKRKTPSNRATCATARPMAIPISAPGREQRLVTRGPGFEYPVVHSGVQARMCDYSTLPSGSPFTHTHPYKLNTSQELQPVERPLLQKTVSVVRCDIQPTPDLEPKLDALPTISSRIPWELIRNPIQESPSMSSFHHHVRAFCEFPYEYEGEGSEELCFAKHKLSSSEGESPLSDISDLRVCVGRSVSQTSSVPSSFPQHTQTTSSQLTYVTPLSEVSTTGVDQCPLWMAEGDGLPSDFRSI